VSELETQNAELIEQINSLQKAYGRMVDEHFEEKKELKAQLAKANERIAELESHIKECDEYLDINRYTAIGNMSILHRQMKQLRKEQDDV
jgi:predicted  nucleic acid-binding Zn-ribbon protein